MWNLLFIGSTLLTEGIMGNNTNTEEEIDYILESSGYPKPGDIPVLNRKVFKGQRVAIRENPYVVSIRRQQAHYLVGTLLTKNIVVSVAHPLYKVPTPELGIVMGENYADRGGRIFTVVITILHQNFDPYTLMADLALLRIYEDAIFKFSVKPISLASYSSKMDGKAFVTGWGRCDTTGAELCLFRSSRYYPFEKFDPMLRTISFNMSPNNYYCEGYKLHDVPLQGGMLCTGPAREEEPASPCLGVPGAPLVVNARLAGLLSWGFGCGYSHDLPLVYTSMQTYSGWILHNIIRLGKITKANLTEVYSATKAYCIAEWLMKTRVKPVPLKIKTGKLMTPLRIDHELISLSGKVYDVRDFINDGSFHAEKKTMYAGLLRDAQYVEKLRLIKSKLKTVLADAFLSNNSLSDEDPDSDVSYSKHTSLQVTETSVAKVVDGDDSDEI